MKHLLHGKADLDFEPQEHQEEIDVERYPYLGEHRVLRGSQKGLHLEVLRDPLEKELYLPALLVQLGNGLRTQAIGIGDKTQFFSSFRVTVADLTGGVGANWRQRSSRSLKKPLQKGRRLAVSRSPWPG